jgi:hypothetical protein
MVEIVRRKFLTGLVALVAAPAIVRISSIMPVKAFVADAISMRTLTEYVPDQLIYRLDILYGCLSPWPGWPIIQPFETSGATVAA